MNDLYTVKGLTDNGTLRIRFNTSGIFEKSTAEKYGLLFNADMIQSTKSVKNSSADFEEGSKKISVFYEKGYNVNINLSDTENIFGLGYRKTGRISIRGEIYRNHVKYGANYGPVPFILSDEGWGVFYNTTYDTYFDVGKSEKNTLRIYCEKGEGDIFLFFGSKREILKQFIELTGKPLLMPVWAYGFMFITNEKETQFDVLNDAREFIREEIPCDMIGLEPGWMEDYYDTTTKKQWNKERFYLPWWTDDTKQFKNDIFIGALKRQGIHTSLWLACDYDVFDEEEKRLNETYEKPVFDLPEDTSLQDFDPNAHPAIMADKITVPGEAWFEHLKKFVDEGVEVFKQDPAFVVNDHPDRLYANGMTDDEAHNLYTSVLAKQFYTDYANYTKKRPMHYMGSAYIGVQHWAPTWTCDCGGRETALIGMLQHSLCGHSNITCDMDISDLKGIHFGFLQPWCQLNSWAFIYHPWWLGKEEYESFKYYARLRYGLIPYIYSNAYTAHIDGLPVMRAMPLVCDDKEAVNLTNQYMLGDYLLVGAYTDKIYLPDGEWIDYWTGDVYGGKRNISYTAPKNRGGALFVKKGAIIPMWDKVANTKGFNDNKIILEIYPDSRKTEFTLYRDDGVSLGYENKEYAFMKISCEKDTAIKVCLSDYCGSFNGMLSSYSYRVNVHDGEKIYSEEFELETSKSKTIEFEILKD